MSTISRAPAVQHRTGTETDEVRSSAGRTALGVLRIVLGWTFLWAFLDKLLALGYATGVDPETGAVDRFGDAAWINGGSPTFGFLTFGADGPFKGFYNDIAGAAWADLRGFTVIRPSEARVAPRSVRENPGAYRTVYRGPYRYLRGK